LLSNFHKTICRKYLPELVSSVYLKSTVGDTISNTSWK